MSIPTTTWHCPRGCNSFSSTHYDDNNPPECGSCGSVMSIDDASYNETLQGIEDRSIAEHAGSNPNPDVVRDQAGQYSFKKPVSGDRILALASQILAEKYADGCYIDNPEQSLEYFQLHLGRYEREVFACLWLSHSNRIIKYEELFFGTINASPVYCREVVKNGLRYNAATLLVGHNHPSGNPTPSIADRSITAKLKAALDLVDIKLLDHIVVGGGESRSMAVLGML